MKILLSLAVATFGGLGVVLLTAATALAIDCSKASTATEKAICAAPAALQADHQMSAAFSALIRQLSAPQKKLLVANQSAWIAERESCTSGDDEDGAAATPAQQTVCITKLTGERRAFLAGLPAEGPGVPAAIVPVIRHGADDTFLTSLAFPAPTTPGEKLFNATLAADFAKMHAATNADDYSDNFNATLTYASPELISVNVVGADLSPKLAHPMPFEYNVNIDMQTGKKLTIANALDKAGIAKIQQQCMDKQLKDYLANPDSTVSETDPDMIKVDIADLDNWSFGATEAQLDFDPMNDDPTAVCHLPYSDLSKLTKASFPLPQ
jgi:uncharacterized protein YecT (DUF1311 family)